MQKSKNFLMKLYLAALFTVAAEKRLVVMGFVVDVVVVNVVPDSPLCAPPKKKLGFEVASVPLVGAF